MANNHVVLSAQEALQMAWKHHQAGRLQEARNIYLQLLQVMPDHFDALHLLGVIARQQGNYQYAVELIEKAIASDASHHYAYNNLGLAYAALNRITEAEECYRKALAVDPTFAEAQNNLGVVLQEQGRLRDAESCFRDALKNDPDSVNALNNLAVTLKDEGLLDEAETIFRKVLSLTQDRPEIYRNLGHVLHGIGELEQAVACYMKALEISPEYVEALNDLGGVWLALGHLDQASVCLQDAYALNPELPEVCCNLGRLFQERGDLDTAESYLRKALKLSPDFADAHDCLGGWFKEKGELELAKNQYEIAISLQPETPDYQINLGAVFCALNLFAEAETCYRKALALNAESASAQWNLSMVLLLREDYEHGLPLYESRLNIRQGKFANSAPAFKHLRTEPRWQGEPLDGKRLLIWTEQGLGDSLMVMRYLTRLKTRGASRVMVYCEHSLARLIQAVEGVDQVIPDSRPIPFGSFDLHCPMMSLPFLFSTRLNSIHDKFPYLFIPLELTKKWQERLSCFRQLKVGLAWAGGKTLQEDAKRSIPLALFAPLLNVGGVQLISLQKGEEARQLAALNWGIPDWMDECKDFMDTAALVENLDLVISVDTAVAHLAGALGKRVWLLNRFESEWRWGLVRNDSPWYPSMRIFRQAEPLQWASVIRHVTKELEKQVAQA